MPTHLNSTESTPDTRAIARAEFVALLGTHGDDIPLTEAAAWMCAEERGLTTIDPLMDALAELSEGLYVPEGTPIFEAVARLNHHLFETLGFHGDKENYGHPDNSLLDSVLRDRKGIPITLSLITMAVAETVGIKMHGIGFPTHFLVSPASSLPRFFVDPFYRGRVLNTAHLEPWFERISSQSGGTTGASLSVARALVQRRGGSRASDHGAVAGTSAARFTGGPGPALARAYPAYPGQR